MLKSIKTFRVFYPFIAEVSLFLCLRWPHVAIAYAYAGLQHKRVAAAQATAQALQHFLNTMEMELITTYICKDFDIGIHNNMFGGKLMSLIDDAAGSFASQICDSPNMVTIKVDELVFKKAVKSGAILKVYGKVVRFGNSSIELYMEIRKHNVYTGNQDLVTHTNMTFVRIDEEGKSLPIAEYIKKRHAHRIEKYGKALLLPTEEGFSAE